MINYRSVSDTSRANWSSLLSGLIGVGVALAIVSARGGIADAEPVELMIVFYLVTWPVFGAVYLGWTHLAHAAVGPRTLGVRARRETARQARWWAKFFGYGGASSWTLTAALAAIVANVVIAQSATFRSDLLFVALGLLCVGCSWALMVDSFALQYLRLQAGAAGSDTTHIDLGLDGDAHFEDYLTLAVLLSTMAALVSAEIGSRQAWRLVRTNVLFAFTFNSVIVAMVVSLLLGGLVGSL